MVNGPLRHGRRRRRLLTGSHHVEQARHGLVPDTVDRPAGQRAVVQVGDGRVPEHAARLVVGVPLRRYVDRLARVVELPPEPLGRRVGVHLAWHVRALAPGRANHQHPVGPAARSVCASGITETATTTTITSLITATF